MLIGIDNVLSWAKSNNTTYWMVKSGSSEKSHLISASSRDESEQLSTEDSLSRLRQELERLGNGNYFITGWPTMGQTKNRFAVPFQITNAAFNQQHTAQVPSIGSVSMDDIEKRISDALERERAKVKAEAMEKELADLRKENKELKAESDNALNRIVDRVGDVMGLMDIGTKKKPEQSAAIPSNVSGTNTDIEAEGERIGQLLEQWAAQDPDFAQTLQGIVSLSKNDPTKYKMGKNFLK